MGKREKIPAKIDSRPDGSSVETHPSFGMVSLSRWTSGGGRAFFGSAVEPHAGVSLTISRGEKHRSLSNDWYHSRDELIEISMTEAQFAQMITSFNIGGGVPCTISHIRKHTISELPDGLIPECPEVNDRKLIEQEFDISMKRAASELKKLVAKAEAFKDKPSINKADRAEFASIAAHIGNIVSEHFPFVQQQFNEAIDTTVAHAKADVDGFITNLLRQAGVEAIREKIDSMRLRDKTMQAIEGNTGQAQLGNTAHVTEV